jgi:large subunit ribosomal protein L25
MKKVSLSGSLRESVGKKDAKNIRKEGRVPCVIYGGKANSHFSVDEKEFGKLIFTPETYIVNLTIGENEHLTILQDVQYHPVTDKVLHADFLEITTTNPIKVALPINFVGTSPGVSIGGRLIKNMRKLLVKGLMDVLPEFIEVSLAELKIGDTIKIEDMQHDDYDFLDVQSELIVAVRAARAVVEEEEEEEKGESPAEGDAPAEA